MRSALLVGAFLAALAAPGLAADAQRGGPATDLPRWRGTPEVTVYVPPLAPDRGPTAATKGRAAAAAVSVPLPC